MKSLIIKKIEDIKKISKGTALCCAKSTKNTPGCHD